MSDNDVQQVEEEARVESEAQSESTDDEEAVKATEVESGAEAESETPVEVIAINTDTAVAAEINETNQKKGTMEDATPEKAAPSGKFKKVIEEIEGLSVLELSELVKELEERFGVSAAPVALAAAGPAAGDAPAAEEKSRYTVMLVESGAQKINVIKAVREINQNLGLKEAKDLVDSPPKEIAKDLPKEEAETAKKKLEDAGAKVELR